MKRIGLVVLAILLAFALSACGQQEQVDAKLNTKLVEASDAKDATKLTFTAQNWKWDKPVYTVKANEPVTLNLDNKSGYHGVDITKTGITVVMDKPQTVVFKKPGTYTIKCSVICGTGHTKMTAKLVVE